MHVLLVILGGTGLLGLFLHFGRLWAFTVPTAAAWFIPVWLGLSVTNLLIGVLKAGYPLREELPILLLVFILPSVLTGTVIWYFGRA